MSLIVLPSSSTAQNPCRVAYSNLLELGTVVASSENAAYPVANAYDWRTDDFFRPAASGTVTITLTLPTARAANYFAFYAQDVWQYGGNLKLQYWDGAAWQDATVGITPNDNAPRIVFFNSITATQWRVSVDCTDVFNLGMVSFGEYLALPLGMYLNWTPPVLGRSNSYINSVSEGGAFLGRSVTAKGIATSLILQGATDEWVRTTWLPFIKHIEAKPFWFAPHVVNYPTECAYCWADGEISPPVHSHYGYMSQNIGLRGLIE